ncbi:TetR/AcrR family transcriptional regulator [Mumia sp. DW29H23]|uniref:TetR/AcrR family transcriptional regulator n=1 Tax=Mumia sp. DW29H23 TaxID=3421241 RepID=UPI003D695236
MTRDKERTRRAILDATESLVIERGTDASLADIAKSAGVSKSGLLHHFPSRDALMHAMAVDVLERFRTAVHQRVDLSENRPGKLLRGYVRALFDEEVASYAVLFPGFWGLLASASDLTALSRDDEERWLSDLTADGLEPELVTVVRFAAERAAATPPAELAVLSARQIDLYGTLLAMAEPDAG